MGSVRSLPAAAEQGAQKAERVVQAVWPDPVDHEEVVKRVEVLRLAITGLLWEFQEGGAGLDEEKLGSVLLFADDVVKGVRQLA